MNSLLRFKCYLNGLLFILGISSLPKRQGYPVISLCSCMWVLLRGVKCLWLTTLRERNHKSAGQPSTIMSPLTLLYFQYGISVGCFLHNNLSRITQILMSPENFGSNKMKALSQIGWAHDCNLIIQSHLSQVAFWLCKLKFLGWGSGTSFSKLDH